MSGQLKDTASELAGLLWREHTVYRDRAGGVVIRGEHVQRWISLAVGGGRDEVLVRAGRILDGGTTAPARSEAVVDLSDGTAALATVCRRLLSETAATPTAPPHRGRSAGGRRTPRGRAATRGRHTSLASWAVVAAVVAVIGLYVATTTGRI
ncbi:MULTISPECIES: hypothetical protein [unclassified Streptomyces]|uniref:hypothetical protein n=1 Tax=unclassified Streptomyces TaxID=2593676 RepID=UPI000D6AFD59|nr:hypothetical protein [Streptomyces sp. CG 926]PWK63618.1 hypothetical protein BCL76_11943 [Streptomyces sp. CG 926]